jgi:DNA mismatch endonuclease (patch repair protein)
MAAIGPKNTRPELLVRRALHAAGLRFRLHRSDLPGKPDIVLPKRKAVVFVQGCFWHHHVGCRNSVWPVARAEFWRTKISGNMRRDRRNLTRVRALGWMPYVIWECQCESALALRRLVRALAARSE